jgi:predicted PurR-regulated permease PerM
MILLELVKPTVSRLEKSLLYKIITIIIKFVTIINIIFGTGIIVYLATFDIWYNIDVLINIYKNMYFYFYNIFQNIIQKIINLLNSLLDKDFPLGKATEDNKINSIIIEENNHNPKKPKIIYYLGLGLCLIIASGGIYYFLSSNSGQIIVSEIYNYINSKIEHFSNINLPAGGTADTDIGSDINITDARTSSTSSSSSSTITDTTTKAKRSFSRVLWEEGALKSVRPDPLKDTILKDITNITK